MAKIKQRVEQLVCCAEAKGIDCKEDIIDYVLDNLENDLIGDNGNAEAQVREFLEEIL